ncbi:hypothetical protein GCM10022403_066850 [Streptomyces coacervatus]|uniref:Ricin B lectin domain-containing protein n=1 Tax=Streptomyces coacervatus TaxID=647381 RepID=A0ABP7IQ86_9ACTN|nr:RICIN domain-containing protein [Streptomyces coacervatus]MDF2266889.1 RICIN domain-containing protein [Streptomyces coacervatus]
MRQKSSSKRGIAGRVLAAATLVAGTAGLAAVTAAPAHAAVNKCAQKDTFKNAASGWYLDAKGAGGQGTEVDTWYWNGHANEYWCLEKAAEGGWYLHPSYNLKLCMDSPSVNNDNPIVWRCKGNSNQRFSVFHTSQYGGGTEIQLRSNGYVVTGDNVVGGPTFMDWRLSDFGRSSLWK